MAWHYLAKTSDIRRSEVRGFMVAGLAIAVYNVGGEFFATRDCCSHQEAQLSRGFLLDEIVECPLHGAKFNVKTGAAVGLPATRAITTYQLKITNEEIYIFLDNQNESDDYETISTTFTEI